MSATLTHVIAGLRGRRITAEERTSMLREMGVLRATIDAAAAPSAKERIETHLKAISNIIEGVL